MDAAYQAIADHGRIGDLQTAALVATDGTVDWCCAPYVSVANCGLRYHVGGVIEEESSLLVANARVFREQFAVDRRTGVEAVDVSPGDRTVRLRAVATGEERTEASHVLVLSPGARSIRWVPPEDTHEALERGPDDIKVVVDFTEDL